MTISRRTALVILGGGIVATGAGGAFFATMADEDLVHAVLERHLGGFLISQEDLAEFLADFRKRQPWLFPPSKLAAVYGAAEKLNIQELARANMPGGRGEDITRFERHLISDFLAQTDFGFRSDVNVPVAYLGAGACLNPFARFT